MTNLEAVNLLIQTAAKGEAVYHPGYKWAVKYSKECKAYFAGVDIDQYLKQFARREVDDLFDQRKEITAHVNRALGAALMRPFQKVPRSNFTRVLAFSEDTDGRRATQFDNEVLSRFYRGGLDKYIFSRLLYWSIFDPNCFLVVEFDSTDGRQRARPYPFEVRSDMAVRYEYDRFGFLQWLVSRQVQSVTDANGLKQDIERLTVYQPMQTVVLQQLTDAQSKTLITPPAKVEALETDPEDGQLIRLENGKVYQIIIPLPHGFDKCPAFRCGYMENPEDDGATRVSIFDAALPYAKKIVKINSELDITTAFLAFPVSVRYEDRCEQPGCVKGQLPDGTTCGACRGSGFKPRPTSAAEEILLPLPSNPEDMLDVTKILHYAYPPTEAVKMQMELMSEYMRQAKEAVYNSQMFSKQETAQTATFHAIELQSVYDTLYPYALNLASAWAFVVDACRVFTGFTGTMTAALVFPQDFRFETAAELFAEMKSAREAGAGKVVTDMIGQRIVDRMLIDDKERAEEVRSEMRLDPFSGMTEAQVLQALSSDLVPRWKKVLYANMKDILLNLEMQTPGFFRQPLQTQIQAAKEAAEALAAQIDADRPQIQFNFPDLNAQ